MSTFDEIEYIKHIYSEIQYLETVLQECAEDEFFTHETYKRAVTRSFEIIGEASKKVTIDFKLKYSSIPWSEMAKMRDKIIHHYHGVDYELIWNIMKEDIPHLNKQIFEILDSNSNN